MCGGACGNKMANKPIAKRLLTMPGPFVVYNYIAVNNNIAVATA